MPANDTPLASLSAARRRILTRLKTSGPATIAELAGLLDVSYEAARQQVSRMERDGWIERFEETPAAGSGGGRPTGSYRLTDAGEHLFPKAYNLLTVELIDSVVENFGVAGLRAVLSDMTESRVRHWRPALEGKTLEERLHSLTDIYLEGDPFMEVERDERGYRLVERNCPFLDVARQRPSLCSLTVSTLQRLLGVRVVREESFQGGDGRCAFRVQADQPVEPWFDFEFEELTDGVPDPEPA